MEKRAFSLLLVCKKMFTVVIFIENVFFYLFLISPNNGQEQPRVTYFHMHINHI